MQSVPRVIPIATHQPVQSTQHCLQWWCIIHRKFRTNCIYEWRIVAAKECITCWHSHWNDYPADYLAIKLFLCRERVRAPSCKINIKWRSFCNATIITSCTDTASSELVSATSIKRKKTEARTPAKSSQSPNDEHPFLIQESNPTFVQWLSINSIMIRAWTFIILDNFLNGSHGSTLSLFKLCSVILWMLDTWLGSINQAIAKVPPRGISPKWDILKLARLGLQIQSIPAIEPIINRQLYRHYIAHSDSAEKRAAYM